MRLPFTLCAALCGITFLVCSCVENPPVPKPAAPIPQILSADIASEIERHIRESSAAQGGKFHLSHGDQTLSLRLVRIHMEYLAQLGLDRSFACVDLVNDDGKVYDVDFFLSGPPGNMTVTNTTVHKLNGRPYYTWEQTKDGGWTTVPADQSDDRLLGVITGTDAFEFIYRVTLPRIEHSARMWLPIPASDRFQTIHVNAMETPGPSRILTDRQYGNQILFLELEPHHSSQIVELRFDVKRNEKNVYTEVGTDPSEFVKPESKVPNDPQFKQIADEVLKGKTGDLVRARALYDHVIDRMSYMKFGEGFGKGDALYACDARTGNCSDFHAYFIALARAANIPARFAIGASIPSERNEGGIDGYHCWAEFYADGQWWPVDISEANKYSRLATYYFGRHPANRIELSRGRDLVVEPGPKSGPINFLAYPVLEVDGVLVRAEVLFGFFRKQAGIPVTKVTLSE